MRFEANDMDNRLNTLTNEDAHIRESIWGGTIEFYPRPTDRCDNLCERGLLEKIGIVVYRITPEGIYAVREWKESTSA